MSLAKFYLDKLQALETRYEELSSWLSDPQVMSDPERYAKLAKELSSLEDVVKTFQDYKRALKELEENKLLLEEEKDEELRALFERKLNFLKKK